MEKENVVPEETQATEEKIVCAYTIYRMANGNTRVENAKVEGAEELSTNQIFNDILVVARQVKEKKQEELVERAAFNAMAAYMQAAVNQAKAEEVEAEVEAPEQD